jgi:uncharacterized protein (TIGR03437 family)
MHCFSGGPGEASHFRGARAGAGGVYQVNVIVPSGLSPGVQRLTWIGPAGAITVSNIAVK